MANEDQGKPQDDFPETPQENSSFGEKKSVESGSQQNKGGSGNKKDGEKDAKPKQNIIINIPPNSDVGILAEAKKANRYTRIGLWVNTFLFLCTLGALIFTWKSVDISGQALADNRKNDSISKKTDSIRREQDFTKFVLESRAFLQITDVAIDSIGNGFSFSVKFNIRDMGKFPANIFFVKIGVTVDKENTIENVKGLIEKEKAWQINNTNEIISSTTKIGFVQPFKFLTRDEYERFKKGVVGIYVFVEVNYVSLGIEKKYTMRFGEKISREPVTNKLDFRTIEYSDAEIK